MVIVNYIGTDNQSCPILIIDKSKDSEFDDLFELNGKYKYKNDKYKIVE